MSVGDGESAPCIVVGAGPAGLAMAACLKRVGREALLLDQSPAIASSWRNHYQRLHLHTVKEHSGLPFRGFARDMPRYPSRQQVVDYLEDYAAHFELEPRCGVTVHSVRQEGQ